MPLLEIEVVELGQVSHQLSQQLADACALVLESRPSRAWVKLRGLERWQYAENGPPTRPVFVSLTMADPPASPAPILEKIAVTVAQCLDRPVDSVHVVLEPAARGRVAFGGKLLANPREGSPVQELDPSHIMEVGMGFRASKTLLSAVELGLFTRLSQGPMSGEQLVTALQLHPRAHPDFFDALVALRFLDRQGSGPQSLYSNTAETAFFLDRDSPGYIGGRLEMANARAYGFWGDLTTALRTGQPQSEVKRTGEPVFARLYEQPERLEQFMEAMSGISAGNFLAFSRKFDFSNYTTHLDVGGASAQLSCLIAQAQPHMQCRSLDLPPVQPIAQKRIRSSGLEGRVSAIVGDFFRDALPAADIITMGMILHDWSLENKKMLIGKAFDALPSGGALVAIEAFIDDERRENSAGLLMSLHMLLEFGDAFDFSAADFKGWCQEAGFDRFEVLPLTGPSSAAIAYKP